MPFLLGALLLATGSPRLHQVRPSPIAEPAYSLRYRPKGGEELVYDARIEVDAEDTKFTIVAKIVSKVENVKEDGGYTLESTFSAISADVNGEAQDVATFPPLSTKTTYDGAGKVTESTSPSSEDPDEDGSDPFSLALSLASNYIPSAPVRLGESYTPPKVEGAKADPIEFKLAARERRRHREALVVKGEATRPDGSSVSVVHRLSSGRFLLLESVISIKDMEMGDPDEGESSKGSISMAVKLKPGK